jgi:hypothetical protein
VLAPITTVWAGWGPSPPPLSDWRSQSDQWRLDCGGLEQVAARMGWLGLRLGLESCGATAWGSLAGCSTMPWKSVGLRLIRYGCWAKSCSHARTQTTLFACQGVFLRMLLLCLLSWLCCPSYHHRCRCLLRCRPSSRCQEWVWRGPQDIPGKDCSARIVALGAASWCPVISHSRHHAMLSPLA